MPGKHTIPFLALGLLMIALAGCSSEHSSNDSSAKPSQAAPSLPAAAAAQPTAESPAPEPTSTSQDVSEPQELIEAAVVSVAVSGNPEEYQIQVGVSSPDTGCEQYADWWEVLSENGALLYRRILLHSHVNEQPFVRSGGPVEISPDTVVIVRAHMNQAGYGSKSFKGSVMSGFSPFDLPQGFGADLETQPPLPSDCNF